MVLPTRAVGSHAVAVQLLQIIMGQVCMLRQSALSSSFIIISWFLGMSLQKNPCICDKLKSLTYDKNDVSQI